MAKFFVTGGAGFIGSNIVDRLVTEGHKVTVFDNLSSGRKSFIKSALLNNNCRLIIGDLKDTKKVLSALKGHDIVIHLAANPDVSKGVKFPELDFQETIANTFGLLQAMREVGMNKIFYFSGSGVYGDVGRRFVSETEGPLHPASMYGASKLAAESLIYAFVNLYGFQTWVLRPANIIGRHVTHGVVFDFVNRLQKDPKNLRILGDGRQTKSYLYVSDVVDAVMLLIKKTKKPINLYNISSDSFISVNQIADCVIAELGLNNVKRHWTGGRGGWVGDVPVIKLDNSKLNKIGWRADYSCKQAIIKTVKDLLEK